MGMRRAHDAHVQLMRKIDVAGELAAAGDQRRVFQPLDRLADPLGDSSPARIHAAARSSARRVTASTRSRRNSALVVMSSIGSTAAVAAAAAARNALSPGAAPASARSASAMRRGLGSTPPTASARLDDLAAFDAIGAERRRHGEIAGAAAELVEAAARVRGEHRQARLDQQLVVAQRRRHDALEEIARRNDALAARALGQNLAVERRQHQAHSDDGSACARLPQNVPRLRIG